MPIGETFPLLNLPQVAPDFSLNADCLNVGDAGSLYLWLESPKPFRKAPQLHWDIHGY